MNRWIREMLFDYENSRWHWATQVYEVHGLLADMSEHTPQNVAWRAYIDSCIYDGCYKVMNTVRIWGFNMSNEKNLTFKSGGLKVIGYVLGNLWEQVGCWSSLVALNIRAANNDTGDINEQMIMGTCLS